MRFDRTELVTDIRAKPHLTPNHHLPSNLFTYTTTTLPFIACSESSPLEGL